MKFGAIEKNSKDQEYKFCSFRTSHAGQCGIAFFDDMDEIWCERHRGKNESAPRKRKKKYSGFSPLRIREYKNANY